jgi:hypothetical protein
LEEVALELLVGVMMFKFAVHVDITVKTPVSIFVDRLVQGRVSHCGTLEELQKPVGHGQDHVVIVTVIVGCRVDLLDPGNLVGPMFFGESCHMTIWELLDPVSGLPHSILDRDGKAWAATVTVEHIPLWAFFSGESGTVVDEACSEEFELFPLGVALPGPLLMVFPMFALMLFEGADETASNVGDHVEVVRNLDGSCSCAG